MFGSFSPDGKTLAVDVSERPPAEDVQDAAARVFEPRWGRLALVAVDDGEVHLADGHFDKFATAPVWNADGSWLIAPVDKSMFARHLPDTEPTLQPLARRRGRPSPLLDITQLFPGVPRATLHEPASTGLID